MTADLRIVIEFYCILFYYCIFLSKIVDSAIRRLLSGLANLWDLDLDDDD